MFTNIPKIQRSITVTFTGTLDRTHTHTHTQITMTMTIYREDAVKQFIKVSNTMASGFNMIVKETCVTVCVCV